MNISRTIVTKFIIASLALLGMASCSKEEGKGGKAAIQGYVYKVINDGDIVKDVNGIYKFSTDTIPAIDKTVFIVYGGGTGEYDDKTGTNAFGFYKFDYLREGNYMIYAVGDSASQKTAVMRNVKIGSSGTNTADAIYVNEGKNSKMSGIVGCVKALYPKESSFKTAVGLRVYIKASDGGEQNDTRTDDEGIFRFAKLHPNTIYTIWVESEPEKNYAVTAEKLGFTTGAEGTVTDLTNYPINVTIY